MRRKLLFILLLLCIPSLSFSADIYWVDFDDGAAASWATCESDTVLSGSSCCTKAQLVANVSAGDTVYLRTGTLSEETFSISASGTEGNPIIIQGYQSEIVTIDGNWTTSTPCSNSYLVNILGDWITLKNIIVTKAGDYGLKVQGDNCTMDNVDVQYSFRSGMVFYNVTNGTCQNSEITQNGYVYSDGSFSGDCASPNQWGAALTATGTSTGVTFQNNTVYNNWGEGISQYYGPSNGIIQDNLSYNNCSVCIYLDSIEDATVRRNILYIEDDQPGSFCNAHVLKISREASYGDCSGHTIINNFIMGGGKPGVPDGPVLFGFGGQQWGIVDMTFSFNTIIGGDPDAGATLKVNTPANALSHSNSEISNNIFYESGSTPNINNIDDDFFSGVTLKNNLFSQTQATLDDSIEGTNDVYKGDPSLVLSGDKMSGDYYKIQSDSDARDSGTSVSGITDDYFEISRPRGTAEDIGAHEYDGNTVNEFQVGGTFSIGGN